MLCGGEAYAPVLCCAPDEDHVPSGVWCEGDGGMLGADKCLPLGFQKVPQRGVGWDEGRSVHEEPGRARLGQSGAVVCAHRPSYNLGLPEGNGHGFSTLSWN